MKIRGAALLAAGTVLALTSCQDEQASQGGEAAPTSEAASPTEVPSRTEAPSRTQVPPRTEEPSSTEAAPTVTRPTAQPRIAWSKEDIAQQLRTKRSFPESTSVTCVEGLPARKGATTTCTVAADAGAELYAAVVKPAGVTGAMAPAFVKVSREQ